QALQDAQAVSSLLAATPDLSTPQARRNLQAALADWLNRPENSPGLPGIRVSINEGTAIPSSRRIDLVIGDAPNSAATVAGFLNQVAELRRHVAIIQGLATTPDLPLSGPARTAAVQRLYEQHAFGQAAPT